MVTMTFDADIKSATKWLDNVGKKQIPFATSVALNNTAAIVQEKEKKTMQAALDNPTPTTRKAVRVKRSSKRDLRAVIFILPAVAKFLHYNIEGGSRPPRGRTEAVPVNVRLNKYGNIPGRRAGKIGKILNRLDTFSGVRNGVAGIWQRGSGKNARIKLLLAYEPITKYKPRWKFYDIARRHSALTWPKTFNKALTFALRTAK